MKLSATRGVSQPEARLPEQGTLEPRQGVGPGRGAAAQRRGGSGTAVRVEPSERREGSGGTLLLLQGRGSRLSASAGQREPGPGHGDVVGRSGMSRGASKLGFSREGAREKVQPHEQPLDSTPGSDLGGGKRRWTLTQGWNQPHAQPACGPQVPSVPRGYCLSASCPFRAMLRWMAGVPLGLKHTEDGLNNTGTMAVAPGGPGAPPSGRKWAPALGSDGSGRTQPLRARLPSAEGDHVWTLSSGAAARLA